MALFGFLKNKKVGQRLEELPVSRIVTPENRRRKLADDGSLDELARSIAHSGLLCPLSVRKKGAWYELVSGERRLRAVKRLGYKRVLCIVNAGPAENAALVAMIEDVQSERPDFFEVGECCLKLMNRLHLSGEQLAVRLGKSSSFVEEKLALLAIEPTVRDGIRRYALSERHAKAALALDETEKRLELVHRAGEGGLGAEETELLARRMLGEACETTEEQRPRRTVVRLVRDYRVFLNTVSIACEQLRSGGLKVDMDSSNREDGLDLVISVTRERAKKRGAVNSE
ncbi:MAG: ParB/RepB/Spo0J family partition protein [Clostridia bacterium]|nr:ParB/RepB/Spo0J family partition protein [Clostridia bacterium]